MINNTNTTKKVLVRPLTLVPLCLETERSKALCTTHLQRSKNVMNSESNFDEVVDLDLLCMVPFANLSTVIVCLY